MSPLNAYRPLAERLDALPEGFPATESGAELRLLANLFTEDEARVAAQLAATPLTPAQLADRTGGDARELRQQLKQMVRKGLITAERAEGGLGYRLMPFVVGIFEAQFNSIDRALAELFEAYYEEAFGQMVAVQPAFHRVIPVGESVRVDMELAPYESAADIVRQAKAWGLVNCVCRTQKALIGEPCGHSIEVCMNLSATPGAYDHADGVRAITMQEALDTLRACAEEGLVHSVSNSQQGTWYICNCCTCGCGILRGIAGLGRANAIARSAYVALVDAEICIACGVCEDRCQFGAIAIADVAQVDARRCVGCGVCTLTCPVDALSLDRRLEADILPIPSTHADWLRDRSATRGLSQEPRS